jgi:hypothetical protein
MIFGAKMTFKVLLWEYYFWSRGLQNLTTLLIHNSLLVKKELILSLFLFHPVGKVKTFFTSININFNPKLG